MLYLAVVVITAEYSMIIELGAYTTPYYMSEWCNCVVTTAYTVASGK